jgi:hypothetical protein
MVLILRMFDGMSGRAYTFEYKQNSREHNQILKHTTYHFFFVRVWYTVEVVYGRRDQMT